MAVEICNAIACTSYGLEVICKRNPHFPNPQTIYAWLMKYPEFAKLYVEAKQAQINVLAEEILKISDDSRNDILTKEGKDGEFYEVCNTEFVARSRLRVDTRKWLASKLMPKLYGERVQSDVKVTVTHEQALKEIE